MSQNNDEVCEPVIDQKPKVDNTPEDESDFYLGAEPIDNNGMSKLKEPRVIPSYTADSIEKYQESEYEINPKDKELAVTDYLVQQSNDFVPKYNMGWVRDYKTVTNKPVVDGVNVALRQLKLGTRAKSGKSALLKLTEKIGLGRPISVPLYHSGFTVNVTPFNSEDIIKLEFALVEELNRVGKQTNTLAFSHYEIIFAKVIFDCFKERIMDSTLDLSTDEDIASYISLNDIYIIAWALGLSIYPTGFQAVIPCSQSVIRDEKGKPMCSHRTKLKLNVEDLLHVDPSKLNAKQRTLITTKKPRSLTTEEVTQYRETLAPSETYTYDTEDDTNLSITYAVPTLDKYFEYGEIFIDELHEECIELVRTNKQLDDKSAENILMEVVKLKTYNHMIEAIPIDDVLLTTHEGINEALSIFNSDTVLINDITTDIQDYLQKTSIATVGVPTYTCPTCTTDMSKTELIPLAVYDYFFTLLHSKYKKILERLEKQNKK